MLKKVRVNKYLSNDRGAALLILMTSFVVASMVITTSMINSQQIAESYEAVRVQRQIEMFNTATYGGDFRISSEAGSQLTFVNHHLSNPTSFSQIISGGFTGGTALGNGSYNSSTHVFSGLGMTYDAQNNPIVGPQDYIQQLENYLEENQIDPNDLNMNTLPSNITNNLNLLNNSGLMNAPKIRIEMRDGTPMTQEFFESTSTKLTKIDGTVIAGNVTSLEGAGQPGVYALPTVPLGYYRLRLTENNDFGGTGWMAAAYGTTTLEIPIWIYKNMAAGDVAKTIVLDSIDWWDPDWQYRIKLQFNNNENYIDDSVSNLDALGYTSVSADAETLVNFPIVVRLDSSRLDFTHIESDFSDLRFIDADNETELPFEVEVASYEEAWAHVWVLVPEIEQGLEDYIWLYFGNNSAASTESPKQVWTDRFLGVWHLGNEKIDAISPDYYSDISDILFSVSVRTYYTSLINYDSTLHLTYFDSTQFENHAFAAWEKSWFDLGFYSASVIEIADNLSFGDGGGGGGGSGSGPLLLGG